MARDKRNLVVKRSSAALRFGHPLLRHAVPLSAAVVVTVTWIVSGPLAAMFGIVGAAVGMITQEIISAPSTRQPFAWLAILTPKRIWNEDVGDALETISAMERAGSPRLWIQAKIVSTYFWVLIAVVRELVAALTGRKSPNR